MCKDERDVLLLQAETEVKAKLKQSKGIRQDQVQTKP